MPKKLSQILLIIGVCIGIVQAASVNGIVKDSTQGTAIAGVRVTLREGTQPSIASDTTDSLGGFTFLINDTGSFTVRASLADYITKNLDVSIPTDTSVINVEIPLAKQIYTTVSGVVKDSANESPLAGAIVRLGSGQSRRDTTGADGAFSFDSVATGDQVIQISLTGYVTKRDTVTVNGTPVTANFAIVKQVYTKISGVVKDSVTDTLIAGAVVRLGTGFQGKSDTTGTDGAFLFDSVVSGNQNIQISLSGYVTKTVQCTTTGTAVTLNILLAKPVYATVSGVVTDSASGSPVESAIVRLGTGFQFKYDTTGADGAYAFDSVTGTQTIQVTHLTYATKSSQITISGNVTLDFPLAAVITATISGIVTDSVTNSPIANAAIRVGVNGSYRSDSTGADGSYSITYVREGNQPIRISCNGYVTQNDTVIVSSSDPVTFNIVLVKIITTTVSGIVVDSATNNPIANAVVRLVSGLQLVTDTTGADGAYSLSEVSEGNNTVQVSCAGYTSKTSAVTISSRDPITLDFKLVAIITTTVSGIVTDSATGLPVANAVVRLGTWNNYMYDTTGADGAYSIPNVPEGNQPVKVECDNFQALRDTLSIAGSTPIVSNFKLVQEIIATKNGIGYNNGLPNFNLSAGILNLINIRGSGMLNLFALDGSLIYKRSFDRNCSSIILPDRIRSSAAFIVHIASEGNTIKRKVLSLR